MHRRHATKVILPSVVTKHVSQEEYNDPYSIADMSVLTECWPGPGRGRAQEVHQEDLCAAAGAGGQAGHAAQATRQAGYII